MIARALRIGTFPPVAAARVSGQYITPAGQQYTVTWDAAGGRLLFAKLGRAAFGASLLSAVSSNARTAQYKANGRIALFDVTSTGLGPTPDTDYAFPSVPSGYSLVAVNGNGDAIMVSGANFQIRNLVSGAASGVIAGQSGFSSAVNLYNTGDGWVTQIAPVTGIRSDLQPWQYVATNRLRVNYAVDSTGMAPLARIVAGGLQALPLAGLPRILDAANTVFAASIVVSSAGKAFSRAGVVYVQATLTIEEVDVQGAGGTTATVSKASSIWAGFIRATATGASFVPLSAQYTVRRNVPCTVSGTDYTATNGAAPWNASNDVYLGVPNIQVDALFPSYAGLWRAYGTTNPKSSSNAILPEHVRTVALADGTTIADADNPILAANLLGIPHLGALVSWGDRSGGGTAYNDTGRVRISFDRGATWGTAVLWCSQQNNTAPIRGNPDMNDFRGAIPLFTV